MWRNTMSVLNWLMSRWYGENLLALNGISWRSKLMLPWRITKEFIFRSRRLSLPLDDERESTINWKFGLDKASFWRSFALSPNTCADEIRMFPLSSSTGLTLVERREIWSISRPLWSGMSTSSMMIRLRNPKLMLPMLTWVPSFWLRAWATYMPVYFWTAGMCSNMDRTKYILSPVHTNTFNMCRSFLKILAFRVWVSFSSFQLLLHWPYLSESLVVWSLHICLQRLLFCFREQSLLVLSGDPSCFSLFVVTHVAFQIIVCHKLTP